MTKRDRTVLLIVVGVALLGLFYFFGLKPKRADIAKLDSDIATQQTELDTARGEVAQSQAARAQFAADYAMVARLGKAVPADDDVPSLVYQLESAAERTGIDFRTVDVTKGAGNAPAAPPPPSQQGSGSGSGDSGSGGGSAQANGAPPAPAPGGTAAPATAAAASTLPPGASVGPAGFPVMPFSFTFEGSFFNLSDFLRKVDRYVVPRGAGLDVSGRLLTVDGIALKAAGSGFPKMQATVAATAYLTPPDQGTFGGATPQGPGATPPAPGAPAPASGGGTNPGTVPATATP